MLSPRAHQMPGFLNHKLGDEKAAQMEGMIGRACIEGLLATGDGTEQRPYIVLRTSDEHDVIEHFERELKQQSLTNSDDKHIDLVECTDGSKYWFDRTRGCIDDDDLYPRQHSWKQRRATFVDANYSKGKVSLIVAFESCTTNGTSRSQIPAII